MYKFASDEGFRAGLATWAYFIILFFFVGLRAELCVLLGAIAGLAVWNIVGYLLSEELKDDVPKPEADAAPAQLSVFSRVKGRVINRLRIPGAGRNEGASEADIIPVPDQPRRGRMIGSRRPPKRYIGNRPPKRIGK